MFSLCTDGHNTVAYVQPLVRSAKNRTTYTCETEAYGAASATK